MTASQPSALPYAKDIPDFQQFFALPQANIEALTQANSALARGIEEISSELWPANLHTLLQQSEGGRAALEPKARLLCE